MEVFSYGRSAWAQEIWRLGRVCGCRDGDFRPFYKIDDAETGVGGGKRDTKPTIHVKRGV